MNHRVPMPLATPYTESKDQTMKRWLVVVFVACTALLIVPARGLAQKMGYMSSDLVKQRFEAHKQAEGRLEAQVTEWKEDLASRQRDIEELELEMRKNRLVWSETERQAKDKELEDKRRERDNMARQRFEPGGEYDKLAESLMKGVWLKIYAAAQKVAAAEGYDMVFDKSRDPLVYVNPKFDITVKVMKELGIDAADLEGKQTDAIANDPRNKRVEEPRRRKSRSKKTEEEPESTPADKTADPRSNPTNVKIPKGMMDPAPVDTTLTPRNQDIPR
ncbi:MAG: OmpH family outer membrane protein [Candidatus Kapabacteria bacterium]|jgi:outer membrane protein|nr:OmpH family outer membrane protein [Candidatus Kapabacteria bacterium]